MLADMPAAPSALKRSVQHPRILGPVIAALLWTTGSDGLLRGAEPMALAPGREIAAVVNAEMWAQRADYRGSFPTAGRVIAEVTGLPADCAVQIGSQGFSAAGSPVDWTDGEPGKPIRHTFTVEPEQPGTVWVMIRTRAASVSVGDWAGVSCSATGPWYTLPRSGAAAAKGPAEFEGRPVRGPITFALHVAPEAVVAAATSRAAANEISSATAGGASPDGGAFWFDPSLGCGFEVPPGWRVESPDAATRHLRAPAGDPAAAVRLEVRVVAGTPGAAAGVPLHRVHDERVRAGAELHVMGPLTVAGAPAMFAAHVLPAHGTEPVARHFADTIVPHAGRNYVIVCEGRQDLFKQAMPVYRRIVGSFSFTDRATALGTEVGG